MASTIQVFRGNSFSLVVNSSIEISIAKIFFTVKDKYDHAEDDSEALISKTVTSIISPFQFELILSSADTLLELGTYSYDFKFIVDGQNINTDSADFIVSRPITRRTS